MANDRPTLYAGMTNNLVRRVYEHKNHLVPGFTAKYHLTKLVYFETHQTMEQVMIREKQIKDMNRNEKIEMIKKFNPTFKDLYEEVLK